MRDTEEEGEEEGEGGGEGEEESEGEEGGGDSRKERMWMCPSMAAKCRAFHFCCMSADVTELM